MAVRTAYLHRGRVEVSAHLMLEVALKTKRAFSAYTAQSRPTAFENGHVILEVAPKTKRACSAYTAQCRPTAFRNVHGFEGGY